ncbi:RNA polymerase sigma factor [Pontibacter diazotrophicus]|uniref:RNA polymerase sigma factor n=1 Tax=Pontibacter diazotrophicus TaxID=1400979 RepID=A0A3D8LGA1_9BACT|nr:RNA polymerase sigma factor [Pontibacter diazotrophicus]RDV16366.1 RNA polymerase sigma factor [Pontibacter diazotrophicus]
MEKEFLEIITKHQAIILKVCRMYGSSRDDSEDLFQEIVFQLWRSFPGFRQDAKVTTWMYRLALNTAITSLRKNGQKQQWQPLSTGHGNIPEPETERLDVVYDQELQTAVNVLNKLDKALVMLYLDEKSYREMAEIMELSEANIGVKINRIKKKLKQILNP